MSVDTVNESDAPVGPGRRTWWPWAVLAAAALVLVGVLVGVLIARDDNSTQASGTQQLTAIQSACEQWRESSTGSQVAPASWCSDMVGWMTGRIASGRMMGSMMWANPDQMRETCVLWMANASVPAGADGWCDQMVTWMQQHMGDWEQWDRGWMMQGPMMGGS